MSKKSVLRQSADVVDYDFINLKLNPPKRVKVTDLGLETERFLREADSLFRHRGSKKIQFPKGRGVYNQKQPCMVKMYYGNDKQSHIAFLKNYMPQKNKDDVVEKPSLFNSNYDCVPDDVILDYETTASERFFKFIVSPENPKVPLKHLVRSLIVQIEKSCGLKLKWFAVEHHNTDHPHAHILIDGIDRNTLKGFRFDRLFVKDTARTLASNLCTSLVGPRSKEQIKASLDKLPEAYRYTRYDDDIDSVALHYEKPKESDGFLYESEIICRNDIMLRRLCCLANMGLARKYSGHIPAIFYLEKGWKEKLKNIGRYNTFLSARSALRYTTACNLERYTMETGSVKGIITQRFVMDDEGIWNNAIVIENRKLNKAWYVPLSMKPDEALLGTAVECSLEKSQNGKLRPSLRSFSHRNDNRRK